MRQQPPTARVGPCLEQPAGHLLPFLETYAWITLHPINPITLQKYREAFVTSCAKDDTQDAEYLANLLLNHHAQLQCYTGVAPEVRMKLTGHTTDSAHRTYTHHELETLRDAVNKLPALD